MMLGAVTLAKRWVTTLLPTVPMVDPLARGIVTKAVPLFDTVPVIVDPVKTTVIGVLVLKVRLPVIVTPVKAVGVACVTLPVMFAPDAKVPVLMTSPVTAPLRVPALVTVPTKPDDTDTPLPTLIVGACSVLNLVVGAKLVVLIAIVFAPVSGKNADAVVVAKANGNGLVTVVPVASTYGVV